MRRSPSSGSIGVGRGDWKGGRVMADFAPVEVKGAGFFVVGTFLGVRVEREGTRRDGQGTYHVPAKVGVEVEGGVVAVVAGTNDEAAAWVAALGLVRGKRGAVPINPRPPFGANGPVTYERPGRTTGAGGFR